MPLNRGAPSAGPSHDVHDTLLALYHALAVDFILVLVIFHMLAAGGELASAAVSKMPVCPALRCLTLLAAEYPFEEHAHQCPLSRSSVD